MPGHELHVGRQHSLSSLSHGQLEQKVLGTS